MISAKKEAKVLSSGNKQDFKFKLSKEQSVQIGLDMIPMFQAKEEELQHEHKKLKGLRQEIEGYMEEQGVKIRYAQPLATTHFMNRKIAMPKKSIQQNEPEAEDVSDKLQQ